MADNLYALTADQLKIIQELVHKVRSGRINSPLHSNDAESDYMTPEVFVAYPDDANGIPALDQATRKPGKAICSLYLVSEDSNGVPSLDDLGSKLDVYNVSPDAIDQQFVIAIKGKDGY